MMSLISFLKDSFIEFKDKVEWPKWPQLQSSTTVVAIATILLAVFISNTLLPILLRISIIIRSSVRSFISMGCNYEPQECSGGTLS